MIIYIASAIIVFAAVIFAWACCVVAKRADERIAKMIKGGEEND